MSNKFDNEILREQRKSREEYLELKKMQSGELDPGPKPSEVAIVPSTFWDKLKNIWFHDKKVIIVTILLVAAFVFMMVQCSMKPKYDLRIVLFTYTAVLESQSDKMAAYFEDMCEDINGDGEVNIQIVNCSYNKQPNTTTLQNNQVIKLQAMVASEASALLYITDEDSTEYFESLTGSNNFFESEQIPLGEDFYKASIVHDMIELPKGLTIACRNVDNMMIEKDKNIDKYYEQSQNILKAIKEKSK